MKIKYIKSALLSFLLIGMIIVSGCKEETVNTKLEEELRYFDLFVKHNYPDLVPRESGLYYLEIEEGSGVYPDTSNWLLINYVTTTIPSSTNSKVVVDTYYENVATEHNLYDDEVLYGPFKYKHGTEAEGVLEGISLTKEGGKARLMFSSELGYGSEGTNLIKAYTSLMLDIEIIQVIPDIFLHEEEKITSYIDTVPEGKIQVILDEETGTEMYYIEDIQGSGDSIRTDSTVSVYYRGYLCDEREFDNNLEGYPLTITVGAEQVIEGWEIGLTYFMRGGKGRLVIPHDLAYGEFGKRNNSGQTLIPPYESLVFEIEVLPNEDEEPVE